jgi:hypothetical protein
MDRELRHLIIPVTKDGDTYRAILSDDSCDRDNEYMSPVLIQKWASMSALPLLANHENAMDSFIGAWKNPKVVTEGSHTALAMEPNFFTAAASPKAQQIKNQIDEAAKMGLGVGVSVGFIPLKGMMVGDKYRHDDAELVEASIVPVQSNRNAYVTLAKRFNLGNDTNKKTTVALKDGGKMDGEVKPTETVAPAEVKVETVAPTPAPTAAIPTPEAQMTATAEAKDKEIAEMKAKYEAEIKMHTEAEKKIADELTEYKASIKAAQNAPKGKVPAEMLGQSGVAKEPAPKDEPFNATKAWAKNHGLDVEE